LRAVAAVTSLPQVFINGQQIGGADDLEQWFEVRAGAGSSRAA